MATKPRILIVDDNRPLVIGAERVLRKEGFEVLTAFDGFEGLQKAEKWNPDLILLDILMPRLDGFQVLESVRKYSNVPVLIFTGAYDESNASDVMALGANGYLTKPFLIHDLVDCIREMV
jgi:two-component system response regulator VicR